MDEDNIKKFIGSLKQVSLSLEEKNAIKNQITSKMNEPILTPYYVKSDSLFAKFVHNFSSFKPAYSLALILIFVLSGGMAFAAEGALPGNFLYPIKVGFNEKVGGIFVSGSLNKAERESALIDKRLEEVKNLSLKGELSQEKIKIVTDQISKHVQNSKIYVAELEEKNDFENALVIQAKLQSSLAVNEKIIDSRNKDDQEISAIAIKAKKDLTSITDSKISLETKFEKEIGVESDSIAQIKLKSAKLALNEAISFVEKAEGVILEPEKKIEEISVSPAVYSSGATSFSATSDEPEISEYQKHLLDVGNLISEGEIKLSEGDYVRATKLFEEAYESARDIVLFPNLIKEPDYGVFEKDNKDDSSDIMIKIEDSEKVDVKIDKQVESKKLDVEVNVKQTKPNDVSAGVLKR